jgi:hypothetical protein
MLRESSGPGVTLSMWTKMWAARTAQGLAGAVVVVVRACDSTRVVNEVGDVLAGRLAGTDVVVSKPALAGTGLARTVADGAAESFPEPHAPTASARATATDPASAPCQTDIRPLVRGFGNGLELLVSVELFGRVIVQPFDMPGLFAVCRDDLMVGEN